MQEKAPLQLAAYHAFFRHERGKGRRKEKKRLRPTASPFGSRAAASAMEEGRPLITMAVSWSTLASVIASAV